MKIKILYEDKDILVIDKPPGLVVHRDGKSNERAVTDWVMRNYPKLKDVGEPVNFGDCEVVRPGIVHRLDRETSGVLILTKSKKSYEFFKKQFQDRKIKKTYIAIVNGWPKSDSGIIDKPIGRSPSDFRRRLAGRGARGEMREAVTEWKVLKRFENKNNKFSILEIYPKTGRTHQIRVHLKYLSYPIICDSLYNPKGICPENISRLGLHAKSIEFYNPKRKLIKVESPLPQEFKKLFKAL